MIRNFVFALALAASSAQADTEAKAVVSIGGPVTEIIYALGEQDRIVARDTTSVYPPAANELPDVGYMRALSAEGVLSVGPDLILARDTAGPPEALDQLKAASVPMVLTHDAFTAQAVVDAITVVGHALGVDDKAQDLVAKVSGELDSLAQDVAALTDKRKVMFILSLDGGRMNVAGAGTGADGIISLAGGQNVMAQAYEGYKLVSSEAVIEAAPDLIIMMSNAGDHSGRKDEVLALAPIKLTPAGETGGFATVPGAALGFGPRTATFARDLHDVLYGAAQQ